MPQFDVSLEYNGETFSVASLQRQGLPPNHWVKGLLGLESSVNILPGAHATLVLKPVENLPTQRVAIVFPCGVHKRGVKVPYEVVKKGEKLGAPKKRNFATTALMAMIGAIGGGRNG